MATTNAQNQEGLSIVVFDGGGIRGLSALLILRNVLHRVQQVKQLDTVPLPCDVFNMMAGSSTGGLIALMLGRLRMPVSEAIEAYQQFSTRVFSDLKRSGDGKFKATNLEKAIKAIVKSKTGDEETLLMENGANICYTFVCAMNSMNMNARIPQLFRTYPCQNEEPMSNCTIWQAARATTAAPIFFKPIQIGTQSFVDGGTANNNSTLLAMDEIKRVFPGRQIACILSLGTGKSDTISIPRNPSFRQRLLPIEVIKAVQNIATDCEYVHEQTARRFVNRPNIYFRLNVEHGIENVTLSQWEKLDAVEAHTRQYLKLQDVESRLPKLAEVLEARVGSVRAEDITGEIRSTQTCGLHYQECPPPSPIFTGRRDILDKMHDAFSDIDKRHVYLLYGLGGSGKSQIAYKFVSESQARNRFSEVFFIDASTELTIRASLESISSNKALGETAEDALVWLKSKKSDWLVLFNNADDPTINLYVYFPKCEHGNIIITSRNHEHGEHSPGAIQHVSDMNTKDARDLLLFDLQEENFDAADEIVSELHYLALAIVQARAYIRKCCPLDRFLDLYRKHREEIWQTSPKQKSDDYNHTVYTTWEMSCRQLSHQAACFLQISSFMHHDGLTKGIFFASAELLCEVSQIHRAGDRSWDSFDFHNVLHELLSFSLVEHDRKNDTISIHPLVHLWTRTQVPDRLAVLKAVQTILGYALHITCDSPRRLLLPHIRKAFEDELQVENSLLEEIEDLYVENGLYQEAKAIQEELTERRKNTLGDEHPETLASMEHLAWILWQLGMLKEAEEMILLAMEIRKPLFGDEDPETLASMINLTCTLCQMHRWREAEKFQVVVMEMIKRVPIGDNDVMLMNMMHLGSTLRQRHQFKEAEEIQMAAMERLKCTLGDEHPKTLYSMGLLVETLKDMGRWREVEELQFSRMETTKRVLGEEHPDTLFSINNLALILCQLGRLYEAEGLQVTVLETTKRIFGEEHPKTLISMKSLASTLEKMGQLKEAEELQVEALEIRRRFLGEEHPDTLFDMYKFASTLCAWGRLKEAEELHLVVVETRKRVLGDEHPDTLESMDGLAITLQELGSWRKAEELESVVLEARKRILGNEHPATLISKDNLAGLFRRLGRLDEAAGLRAEAMETFRRVLGDEHPDTLISMENFASILSETGRWKEAEELQIVIVEAQKRTLGDEHPETLSSKEDLASTLRKLGRMDEAEELIMVTMKASRRVLGDEHPNTLRIMGNVAVILCEMFRWKEAEEVQVLAIEIQKRVLGNEHPMTLASKEFLAHTLHHLSRDKEAEELKLEVRQIWEQFEWDKDSDVSSSETSE